MIVSMTGFASRTLHLKSATGETTELEIEIKTLNSRFFEPACKMPSNMSMYEMEIIQRLKKKLLRGRIFFTGGTQGYSSKLERMSYSSARVAEYVDAAKSIQKEHGLSDTISVNTIMGLPHVFSTERLPLSDDCVQQFFVEVDAAIDDVVTARTIEGTDLGKDLATRFSRSHDCLKEIQRVSKDVVEKCKEEIAKDLARVENGETEAKVVLSERYAHLDKVDIHEEVVRFESHLQRIDELIVADITEKGRKLDFTLQELMREINTITAKCSSFEISSQAVDIKVELEKAREQVQNVV